MAPRRSLVSNPSYESLASTSASSLSAQSLAGGKEASGWFRGLQSKFTKLFSGSEESLATRCTNFGDVYKLYPFGTGKHGSTQVCLATRCDTGAEVFVKVRNSFSSHAERRAWLLGYKMMKEVPPSPYLVPVSDVLYDHLGYYVVMDKVVGKDLSLQRSKGQLSSSDVKVVMRQLLEALAELHIYNVLHNDVKLENIMFHKSGPRVRLIDYDAVSAYNPGEPEVATTIRGTDQYISPDAYCGHVSPASDVFSAGVVAYQLIAHVFPFDDSLFNDKGENTVGSVKMERLAAKLRQHELNFGLSVFASDPLAADFVQRLLHMKADMRPTASEALNHPWLKSKKHEVA